VEPSRSVQGIELRREVFGAESSEGVTPADMEDFQALGIEYSWGKVWSRPQLDRRTRSLITLGLLTAMHLTGREMRNHVLGAVRNGCSPDEIRETFIQATSYCGFGLASEALTAANEVLRATRSHRASDVASPPRVPDNGLGGSGGR
jgi:4-carboxymuconolactone decarboxylase